MYKQVNTIGDIIVKRYNQSSRLKVQKSILFSIEREERLRVLKRSNEILEYIIKSGTEHGITTCDSNCAYH